MGTVVDELEDESGNSTSYVVETDYGERMRFPVEQFEVTERGLIYRPLWKEALEQQVDELEERIRAGEAGDSMVVARILNLDSVDPEAIKTLKTQHPQQSEVFDAFAGLIALYRELKQRIEVLEVERLRARSDLTLHAGERLLKHNSRREFAKLVLAERRRYQICDINIKHVRELLERLYDSPYFPEKLFPPLDHYDPAGEDPLAQTSSPASPSQGAVRKKPAQPQPLSLEPTPATMEAEAPQLPQTPAVAEGQPNGPMTEPTTEPMTEVQTPAHTERGGPRVTFTPPPEQLRQGAPPNQAGPPPNGANGATGTAGVTGTSEANGSMAPPSSPAPSQGPPVPTRAVPPAPAPRASPQAMGVEAGPAPTPQSMYPGGARSQPLPNRALDGQPQRGPAPRSGVASQFQGLINRGQASGPMNTAAPGVANSMLSFVNEVRRDGQAKPAKRRPQGAGQALVLNLGQGQEQGNY